MYIVMLLCKCSSRCRIFLYLEVHMDIWTEFTWGNGAWIVFNGLVAGGQLLIAAFHKPMREQALYAACIITVSTVAGGAATAVWN
jgi:hypothetical protein